MPDHRPSRPRRRALVILVVALAAPRAHADDGVDFHGSRDAALTIAAATGWLTLELARDQLLGGQGCRWCDRAPDGSSTLNALDRKLRERLVWDDTGRAALASNLSLYGGAIVAPLGLAAISAAAEGRGGKIGEDLVIVSQASFMALAATSAAKLAFRRQRPYAHAARGTPAGLAAPSGADNVSFFSGHTALAFSAAVSAGTVASMRDYDLAPAIWGLGLGSAVATGYLRIAADDHYMTDVLVGAAVGSLFGFAVPYFLHRDGDPGVEGGLGGAPVSGGALATYSGVW